MKTASNIFAGLTVLVIGVMGTLPVVLVSTAFIAALNGLVFAYPLMILWNDVISQFIHMPETMLRITYWEAFNFIFYVSLVLSAITDVILCGIKHTLSNIEKKIK